MKKKRSLSSHALGVILLMSAIVLEVAVILLMPARISEPEVAAEDTANASPVGPADVSGAASIMLEKIPAMLRELVEQKDPSAAFAFARAAVAANPRLDSHCHAFTHEIGDAAFAKYGSFEAAMKFSDDFCGSGYVHGIIIDLLTTAKDPAKLINTLCQHDDGFCFHGIGHGLMSFTKNDVPRSLLLCTGLTDADGKGRCAEGVFMQNFEDHQMYPVKYVYKDDPLRLCREEARYKSACYHYAGAFLAQGAKDYPDFFRLCDAADKDFRRKCLSGMGAQLLAVHLDDISEAVRTCGTAKDAVVRDACIDGIVSYHLVNYQSMTKTQAFCDTLTGSDNASCLAAMKARAASYK